MKRYEKALADYEKALATDPGNSENFFGRAQTYFDMEQFELARKDCEKLLEISPDYPPAKELLRMIDEKLGTG